MKEFELTLRLRNNRLKRLRIDLGLSPKEIAKAAGISYGRYLEFEGLKRSAIDARGRWSQTALRLASFHGLSPDQLWPEVVLAVTKPELTLEIEAGDLQLGGYAATLELPPTPEELLTLKETHRFLEVLTPRERAIVEARLDGTPLRETDPEHRSPERVRQIEGRALRKIAYVRRSEDARDKRRGF